MSRYKYKLGGQSQTELVAWWLWSRPLFTKLQRRRAPRAAPPLAPPPTQCDAAAAPRGQRRDSETAPQTERVDERTETETEDRSGAQDACRYRTQD